MLEIIFHVVLELKRREELQDFEMERDLGITGHHPPPCLVLVITLRHQEE